MNRDGDPYFNGSLEETEEDCFDWNNEPLDQPYRLQSLIERQLSSSILGPGLALQ